MKSLILISVVFALFSCNKVKTNIYAAKINQQGTEAPKATVIEDGKFQVTWSRSGEGVYFGDFSGVNTDKVSVSLSNPSNPNNKISYSVVEGQIQVYTYSFNKKDGIFNLTDGVLINSDIQLTEFK